MVICDCLQHLQRCLPVHNAVSRNKPTKPTANIRGSLSRQIQPGWWCATPSWTLRTGPKLFNVKSYSNCQGVLAVEGCFLWSYKLAFRILSRGYRHGFWSHLSLSLWLSLSQTFVYLLIPDSVTPWPWVVGGRIVRYIRYHESQQDPHLQQSHYRIL